MHRQSLQEDEADPINKGMIFVSSDRMSNQDSSTFEVDSEHHKGCNYSNAWKDHQFTSLHVRVPLLLRHHIHVYASIHYSSRMS